MATEPGLQQYLELLDTVPTGHRIVQRLLALSPAFISRDLTSPLVGAVSDPIGSLTTVNSKLLSTNPQAVAVIVGHEGIHLIDFSANAAGLTSFGCFDLEYPGSQRPGTALVRVLRSSREAQSSRSLG